MKYFLKLRRIILEAYMKLTSNDALNMLEEIRKLSFQDVQIARVEYAKES